MRTYERGSWWRKWDLHFHTPSSYDYPNKSITNEQLIDCLIKSKVAAVAITDHNKIDVERIQQLKAIADGKLTVFPGIELCSELGGSKSVHYIGIFPEDADLVHVSTTVQGKLDLTEKKIKEKGDNAIYVPLTKGAKVIHDLGGKVSAHAGEKSNTIEEIRNTELYKQALKKDLVRDCIDIYEVAKPTDADDYRQKVFPNLDKTPAVVICSDNHRALDYQLRYPCWIKADTTFAGLRQVLIEPLGRVFLGDIPPVIRRVSADKTRYIRALSFSRTKESVLPEKWFGDDRIEFSHGLVAIIGRRGSGKSALAESLGLIGNSRNSSHFSFLMPKRFRLKNKAENFEASLEWESGKQETRNLMEEVDSSLEETVKCIPQNYLETICNELDEGKGGHFTDELAQVIFSHIGSADRLGCNTLNELIDYRTKETFKRLGMLKDGLSKVNERIVSVEAMLQDTYIEQIAKQHAKKKEELKALAKPLKVERPKKNSKFQKDQTEAIRKKKEEIKKLNDQIGTLSKKLEHETKQAAAAKKLLEKLRNFKAFYAELQGDCATEIKQLGLSFAALVDLKVDLGPVTKAREQALGEIRKLKPNLDASTPDSPACCKARLEEEVRALSESLDKKNRNYQAYVQSLEEWKEAQKRIIGNKSEPGTIKYLEHIQIELKAAPQRLTSLVKDRELKVRGAHAEIRKLSKVYKSLYEPVQDFIDKHPTGKGVFRLDFAVSVKAPGFLDQFLEYIHQGKHGSFYGTEEGRKLLQKIMDKHDLGVEEELLKFLREVDKHLHFDIRQNDCARTVSDQLKQGKAPLELYNFLFSLEYLKPSYSLKWADRDLAQLSPGDRGTLLLIFYLLIDKSTIPLVIDQPEGNLDNETIYETIRPCIEEAKERRQVIIVTHNPNLAVVCDAEQVICAAMDKEDGYKITYEAGAIENPVINNTVVDILEGTRPAFDNRDDKYDIAGSH